MIEVTGNLWTYPAHFRVITTNGDVRRDGRCVMGRGCAKEAAQKFPTLPLELGMSIRTRGNTVQFFPGCNLFSFPVKHHWNEAADPVLIEASVKKFQRVILSSCTYVMPRPGCGNGHLRWEDIRPLLVELPDNVAVIHYG